jgi:chromosome segregation ATPase
MQYLKLAGIDTKNMLSEKGRIDQLVSINKNLKEENLKLNADTEFMKKHVIDDSFKLEYLQDLVDTLNKKLTVSEEQVMKFKKAYTEDVAELKVQLDKYDEKLNILEKNNNHYISQIEHLEDESVKNVKTIKRLETRIKSLDTQKTRISNKMHKLLEKSQEQNLQVIEELSDENNKNKIYLESLICRIREILTNEQIKAESVVEIVKEEEVSEKPKKRGRKKKE